MPKPIKAPPTSPADYLQLHGSYSISPVVNNPRVEVPKSATGTPTNDEAGAVATVIIALIIFLGGMAFVGNRINDAWVEGQKAKANHQGETAIANIEKIKQQVCE